MRAAILRTAASVLLAFLSFSSDASAQCSGGMVYEFPARIRYFAFADGSVSSLIRDLARYAGDQWNGVLPPSGRMFPGSGDVVVYFDRTDHNATYTEATRELHMPRHVINPVATDPPAPPYPNQYVQALFLHEFGHALGWDQAPQEGISVMSNTRPDSYRTDFTSCDRATINDFYFPPPNREYECTMSGGFWDGIKCIPREEWQSPLVVDLRGDGFHLVDSSTGVWFDINADGLPELVAWTQSGGDDAFLVMDRNGNGAIDDATELFGDRTLQPPSSTPNGFKALALLDDNGDQWIDKEDAAYVRLMLWTDADHDGVSQPSELCSLSDAGVIRISTDYKQSQRRDQYENLFRYRAKIATVEPSNAGPYVYDVYLTVLHSPK